MKIKTFVTLINLSVWLLAAPRAVWGQPNHLRAPKERENFQGVLGDDIAPAAKLFATTAQHPSPLTPWHLGPSTVPYFVGVPPEKVQVDEGEVLHLQVRMRVPQNAFPDAFVSWILDGRLVCVSDLCELAFGPKAIRGGKHRLAVMAYNPFGSTTSFVDLEVTPTGVSPLPTSRLPARVIPMEKKLVMAPKVVPGKATAFSTRGAGIYSNDEEPLIIGFMPRNIPWQGHVVPNSEHSDLHMNLPGLAEVFFNDAEFDLKSTSNVDKFISLRKGTTRVNTTVLGRLGGRAPNIAYEVKVTTSEVEAKVPVDAEVIVVKAKQKASDSNVLQDATRIVVVTGSAQARSLVIKNKKDKEFNLPAGSELVIYADGKVTPVHKPDAADIESIQTKMQSREQLDERVSLIGKDKRAPVKKALEAAEQALGEDLAYDALVALDQINRDIATKDARVYYEKGVAYRRVYFVSDAEASFQKAIQIDPDFAKAYWQLAELRTDVANWKAAAAYLSRLGSLISSSHELYPRYLYLSAVVQYKLGENFVSLNDFKRAMWEQELPDALRSSAAQFMDAIAKRKPFNAVLLSGIQYDGNPLDLATNASLPDGITTRATWKTILGAILTWESHSDSPKAHLIPSASLQSFYVKNLSSEFSALDAIVVEANLGQTLTEEKQQNSATDSIWHSDFKWTETANIVFLGNKPVSSSFLVSGSLSKFKLGIGTERLSPDTFASGTYSWIANEEGGYEHALTQTLKLDIPIKAEQKFPFSGNTTDPTTLDIEINPALLYPVGQKLSLQGGTKLSFERKGASGSIAATTTFRFEPGASGSYFLTPWLIAGASLSFELAENSSSGFSTKPVMGCTFTGLF